MGRPAAIILLAVAAASIGTAPASAAEPPAGAAWRALARDIASPWPRLQQRDGRLPDYMDERHGSRYGDSLMGYALIRTGLREDDRALVRTGLRAVTYGVEKRLPFHSSFENFAVAAAYNLARRQAAHYDAFRAGRRSWERFMRRARTTRLQLSKPDWGNHWLIDALSVLELQRTGLRSSAPGAILGGARAASARRARRLVNVLVPRRIGRGRMVLSDPPDQPLAYHGLSIGLYARAIRLMGGAASDSARRALRRSLAVARLLIAPDGDTAYWGRSLQHVWSPAGTAYAAESRAAARDASPAERRADRALAERALARVARLHPVGQRGQWIVPSLAQDFERGRSSLEAYAGAVPMSALALVMLNWTLDEATGAHRGARLPADGDHRATISRGAGRFAVVRRGETWFAVKMTHAARHYSLDDLRYDIGLVSVKRGGTGGWDDLVPERPAGGGGPRVTAGPRLLRAPGAYPAGARIGVDRRGTVTVRGSYRTRAGRRVRSMELRYEPVACGVLMSFRARRGERWAYDALFRAGRPSLGRKEATDGEQRLTITPAPESMRVTGGSLASARDARLHRVRVKLRVERDREVRLRFCEEPEAPPPPYVDPLGG
jgi:hypothetical protein